MALFLSGCGGRESSALPLRIALSADYPPFEFVEKGKPVGFEVDLGRSVAEELGRKAVFVDMSFSAILPSLNAGMADMAASTITVTEERKRNFAFSRTYFCEELQLLYLSSRPVDPAQKFRGRRVACQLGSTMELWLRQNAPDCTTVTVDSNVQAVEALKAGQVDAVVVDGSQAKSFCARNKQLRSIFLARSDRGYAIAFSKNSPLIDPVNEILEAMEKSGKLQQLKEKWGLL
ncbi:MAG: ABC transporter substrate-binding protein [Puniceicoccales bacterium]|nr:ABC transporter substrate-binding protein [Puniceicoccales bacterium]